MPVPTQLEAAVLLRGGVPEDQARLPRVVAVEILATEFGGFMQHVCGLKCLVMERRHTRSLAEYKVTG